MILIGDSFKILSAVTRPIPAGPTAVKPKALFKGIPNIPFSTTPALAVVAISKCPTSFIKMFLAYFVT